jgi:predicted metal-dependent hydrolase
MEVRINPRARRIRLRIDAQSGRAILVLPSERHRPEGLRFAARHAGWIRSRLEPVQARIPLQDGVVLPIMGRAYRVRHEPTVRSIVHAAGDEILVGGEASHLPVRLISWLRAEALRQTTRRSQALAADIGLRVAKVSVRDTRSRWGSCSAAGALSFSWRLVLAPEGVLDYVVAHEVAHLRVRDHGASFWRLVGELRPSYADERRWLRLHGRTLHLYG